MIFVPQVQPSAGGEGGPGFSSPDIAQPQFAGPGQSIAFGEALTSAGLTGVEIASRIQDNIDAADAIDRGNQLFEFTQVELHDAKKGYLSTKLGRDATMEREKTLERIRTKHEALGKSLQTNTARVLYERSIAGHMRDARRMIDGHATRESRSALAGSLAAADANRKAEWVMIHDLPDSPPQGPKERQPVDPGDDRDEQGPPIRDPGDDRDEQGPPIRAPQVEDRDEQGPPMRAPGTAQDGPRLTKEERIESVHELAVRSFWEQADLTGMLQPEAELFVAQSLAELHESQLQVLKLKGDTDGTAAYLKKWDAEIPVPMRETFKAHAAATTQARGTAAATQATNQHARRLAIGLLRKAKADGMTAPQASVVSLKSLEDSFIAEEIDEETYDTTRKFILQEASDEVAAQEEEVALLAQSAETSIAKFRKTTGAGRVEDWIETEEGGQLYGNLQRTKEGQTAWTKLTTDIGKQMVEEDFALVMSWLDTKPENLRAIPLSTMHSHFLVGQPDGRRTQMLAAWRKAHGLADPGELKALEGRGLIQAKLRAGNIDGKFDWAYVDRMLPEAGKEGTLNELVVEAFVSALTKQPGLDTPDDQTAHLDQLLNPANWLLVNESSGKKVPAIVQGIVGLGRSYYQVGDEEVSPIGIDTRVQNRIKATALTFGLDNELISYAQYEQKYGPLTEMQQFQLAHEYVKAGMPEDPLEVADYYKEKPPTQPTTSGLTRDEIERVLDPEVLSHKAANTQMGVFERSANQDADLRARAERKVRMGYLELKLQVPESPEDPAWAKWDADVSKIQQRLTRQLNEWVSAPSSRPLDLGHHTFFGAGFREAMSRR